MGSIIGAGIGAAGSIIGAQQSAKASKQAAQIQAAASDRAGERALTGYNYVTSGPGAAPMQSYIQGGQRALGQQANVQNLMQDLLGIPVYNQAVQEGQPAPAAPAAPSGENGLAMGRHPMAYHPPQGPEAPFFFAQGPGGTYSMSGANAMPGFNALPNGGQLAPYYTPPGQMAP